MDDYVSALSPEQALFVNAAYARGSKLEMSLACSNVPKMDVLSNSDPFCVVYSRDGSDDWETLGSTETIVDTHTCSWTTKFFIDVKRLCSEFRFEVYDRDSPRDKLKDHDYIGFVEGNHIMSIVESQKSTAKYPISRPGSKFSFGVLSITLDWLETPVGNFDLTFDINVEYSVRAKMYFQVMRKMPQDNHYVPVFRSALLRKNDSQFERMTINLTQLCAGSVERTFRIELFQFNSMGRSKLLGFVRTCVQELVATAVVTKMKWNSGSNGFDHATVLVAPRVDLEKGYLITMKE